MNAARVMATARTLLEDEEFIRFVRGVPLAIGKRKAAHTTAAARELAALVEVLTEEELAELRAYAAQLRRER